MIGRRTFVALVLGAVLSACANTEINSKVVVPRSESATYKVDSVDVRAAPSALAEFSMGGRSFLGTYRNLLDQTLTERRTLGTRQVRIVVDVDALKVTPGDRSTVAGMFRIVDGNNGAAIAGPFPFSAETATAEQRKEFSRSRVPLSIAGAIGRGIAKGLANEARDEFQALGFVSAYTISELTFGCVLC